MVTTATHPTSSSGLNSTLLLIGRLLIVWLFLPAGIGKITGFAGTVGYIASKGLPLPEVMAVLAILAEVGGSLALLLGLQTRLVAWALALFSVVSAFFFHNYWAVPEAMAAMQQINFGKNMAIAGGLLALSVCGAGALSLDARRRSV